MAPYTVVTADDNPYATLGVGRQADLAEIRAAHRRLARTYHPDAGGGNASGSVERFQRVQEAYETLQDPLQRREVDRQLDAIAAASAPPSRPSEEYGSKPRPTTKPSPTRSAPPRPATTAAAAQEWVASEVGTQGVERDPWSYRYFRPERRTTVPPRWAANADDPTVVDDDEASTLDGNAWWEAFVGLSGHDKGYDGNGLAARSRRAVRGAGRLLEERPAMVVACGFAVVIVVTLVLLATVGAFVTSQVFAVLLTAVFFGTLTVLLAIDVTRRTRETWRKLFPGRSVR